MATLVTPDAEALKKFDLPRDKIFDMRFAQGMSVGMVDYEQAVAPKKKQLFSRMLKNLPSNPTVVEVGMGSFPNARFLKDLPAGTDLIGVDPNDSMEKYARESADKVGLLSKDRTLRVTHGVAEALPLETGVADAVVTTLTLCSVVDPAKALAEIKRIMKPGANFVYLEHVLSETDEDLAAFQISNTPFQMARADGCHLDRRTGETVKAAGFSKLDAEYFELKDFQFLNPTACGIATV